MHLYLALHKAPRVHFRQEASPTPTCTGKQSRAAPRHSQGRTGPAGWSATFREHQQYLHAGVPRLCPSVAAVMEPNVSLQHPSHALRLVPSRARGRRRPSLRDMHQCTAKRRFGSPHASRVPEPPCPSSETSAIQSAGATQVQATRRVSMYCQAVSQVTLMRKPNGQSANNMAVRPALSASVGRPGPPQGPPHRPCYRDGGRAWRRSRTGGPFYTSLGGGGFTDRRSPTYGQAVSQVELR